MKWVLVLTVPFDDAAILFQIKKLECSASLGKDVAWMRCLARQIAAGRRGEILDLHQREASAPA